MLLYVHYPGHVFEYPLPSANNRRIKLNLGEE